MFQTIMLHNVCRSIWSWVSWICLPMPMEKWREVWVSPRVKMCSNETLASLPTKPLTSSSERLNCQESRVFLLHERPILMLQLFIMLLSFMMMVSKLKLANASYSSACIMELWQDDNIGVPRRKGLTEFCLTVWWNENIPQYCGPTLPFPDIPLFWRFPCPPTYQIRPLGGDRTLQCVWGMTPVACCLRLYARLVAWVARSVIRRVSFLSLEF